jgi:hypothetical protein
MFGHKSGADLSTQSALIQPIEEVRHAKCVTGSRSGPDISDAVSRKKGDQIRERLAVDWTRSLRQANLSDSASLSVWR